MIRPKPVNVVVVDDDTEQRSQLLSALAQDAALAVRGLASSAADALTLIAQTRPDVVVLDLHLADGTSKHIIEQLMAYTPTPILIVSTHIHDRHSPAAVDALVAGAVDALPRELIWTADRAAELHRTVHQISKVPVIRHPRGNRSDSGRTASPGRLGREPVETHCRPPIVAIAASTGGPNALATVLAGLQDLPAPVLIVQHLHPDFTAGLVEWMTRVSALPVQIATQDDVARPGRVYLAPGGAHLRLGADRRMQLHTEPATLHRPSADQLFDSVAQHETAAVGVLLTGMGEDGARGLLAIHRNGGHTLAQNEASCAVFGMPRAAHRMGAVTDLLPLDRIASAIQRVVHEARV